MKPPHVTTDGGSGTATIAYVPATTIAYAPATALDDLVTEPAITRLIVKRVFDIAVGGLLALVATPLILLLALCSAIAFHAWPFFTQERVGQYGRHFTFVKIRSLSPAMNAYQLKTTFNELELPAFSRFLRRQHFDELPQLWLVPLGKMSLVGPRPKMPDPHEPVDPTYNYLRTRVPQGCTGIWQVSEHKTDLPSDAPEYPIFYLQNGGIRLDLWIVWRTALVMTGLSQPTRLSDVPDWARGRGWAQIGGYERQHA